jgi:type II secretory pathway component GspD/PulD (secretin)
MKKNINKLLLALAILCTSHSASAQTESVEVVVSENKPAATVIINPAPGEAGDVSADADDAGTNGEQSNPIEAEEGGFLIKDANINDIFQLLAKRSDKQYFHNNKLNAVEFQVTGHLNGDVEPLKQMEELAFQYGLRMYVKGNTVYAMMSDQLSNLPAKEWTYSLSYLRPTDIEQIKALIQPMLSVGRGIVNYEPKTNTIIVIDTMRHIEMVEKLLKKIDKPKGQIVVEVKILRVNNSVGEQSGVDWSKSLGSDGVSLNLARNLNSVFGLDGDGQSGEDGIDFSESNIVLSPLQISGVLRALNDGNMVNQKSNPVVITEDNEKASISLIDRVPIITTTTNQGTSTSSVSEEVRYTIDASDSTDPETTREIGVTISITPSLLPDGTIRMHMRPRSAQITDSIEGASGNFYPRVSEATIQSIARIPDGHSLVVGGFYGEVESKDKNKVPFLGDIPIINFFFKSKQTSKEKSSLVFVVTPTSYNPSCINSNKKTSQRLQDAASLKEGNDWVDDNNPGPAHEPNLKRTLRGAVPEEAPYYEKP